MLKGALIKLSVKLVICMLKVGYIKRVNVFINIKIFRVIIILLNAKALKKFN